MYYRGFHVVDFILFFLTLALSLGIGIFYCFKKGGQRTPEQYQLGGRKMKLLPVTLSTIVSSVSAITIQALPSEAYYNGLHYLYIGSSGLIGTIIVAFVFVPLFYPLKMTSVFQYLEMRFQSRTTRMLGSFYSILSSLAYMGVVVYGPSIAIEGLLGTPAWLVMLIMTLFSTFYSTVGGIKAVIWADAFQSFIMIVGVFAVLIVAMVKVGGMSDIWYLLADGGRLNVFNLNMDPTQRSNFVYIHTTLLFYWFGLFTQQVSIQRVQTLPTLKKAMWTMTLTGIGFAIFTWLAIFVGGVLYAYYAQRQCDPLSAGYITNLNQLMPYFVLNVLNYPGFPGLFLACIVAASLSTISSSQSSCATCLWEDFIPAKLKCTSEARKTYILKTTVAVFGALCFVMGLVASVIGGSLYKIAIGLVSVPFAPLVGMYILGAGFKFTTGFATSLSGLIALAFNTWMVIGRTTCGTVWAPPLPTTTEGCTAEGNITIVVNRTGSSMMYDTVTYSHELMSGNNSSDVYSAELTTLTPGADQYSCGSLIYLYSLSPDILPFIGCAITVILGLVFSVIQNAKWPSDQEVDPQYLFTFLRGFYKYKIPEEDKYTNVPKQDNNANWEGLPLKKNKDFNYEANTDEMNSL